MTSSVIDVERISKSYGSRVALNDVTFRVSKGAVLGLLGRNGAGKTTTLRILAGVLRPNAGCVKIGGVDTTVGASDVRAQVGYLPESAPLYPELRVAEHLWFRATQKGIARQLRRERVKCALDRVDAWSLRDTCCGHLSRGMRQRVGLADAILAEPPILLLDEPTASLDPNQTRETRKLILGLRQTCTVVVSTHLLAEVEMLCDSAIVVDEGRIVAEGTLDDLYALGHSSEIALTLRCSPDRARSIFGLEIGTSVSVAEVEPGIVRATLSCPAGLDLDVFAEHLTETVAKVGIPLREVKKQTASLEQIFAQLTADEEPK